MESNNTQGEEKPTKEKDNMNIVAIVLIVVLLAFGAYILFFQKPDTAVLDNYQYTNGDSVFEVNVVSPILTYITLLVGVNEEPYTIALRNDPLSLEDIPAEGTFHTRIFNDDEVFVTIHPEANLTSKTTIAAVEIDKIIDNHNLYNTKVSSAFTEPFKEYPVKTCNDGTDKETVIWLTLGSETIVYTDGNCIVIVGTDEDEIIRAADRFIYTLLGIMT